MSVSNSAIDKAISGIGGGFIWSDTTQGQDYWEKVMQNLRDLKTGSGGKDPNDL